MPSICESHIFKKQQHKQQQARSGRINPAPSFSKAPVFIPPDPVSNSTAQRIILLLAMDSSVHMRPMEGAQPPKPTSLKKVGISPTFSSSPSRGLRR